MLEFFGPRQISPATVLPVPQVIRFNPVTEVSNSNFEVSGRVAAATEGRVTLGDAGEGEQRRFVRHSAVRMLAETLAPIAAAGDILILRKYGAPKDGDLVVADVGGVLRARRLRMASGTFEMITLLAEPSRPGGEPPLVIGSAGDEIRIVDGVLFSTSAAVLSSPSGSEAADLGRLIDIVAHAGPDGSVWQVDGDSAVPVALDGQLLVVGAPVRDREKLRALNGAPVFATVEGSGSEPERYFKRLRLAGTVVVLESINTSGRFPPVVCSLKVSPELPMLVQVAPVKGVLFQC
jgi:SOS-response transcriptional repressor LexA